MSEDTTGEALRGSRYEVALERQAAQPITWFVVDRSGRLSPRRMGTGPRALREAIWLARVLNGAGSA